MPKQPIRYRTSTGQWAWPTPEELVEWEKKVTAKHTRSVSPGNLLLLIRTVRSQRKVIEKLTRLLEAEHDVRCACS